MANVGQWAKEYLAANPALKRLYRNAGVVFSGNVVSAGIGLMTLMILTRALPLDSFGHYALITGFVGLMDRLTSFQTWQALIHYGAKARAEGDESLLISLFAFGWLLDSLSGIAGFAISIAAAYIVPGWIGLEGQTSVFLIVVAASVLLINWTSTSTAVLRLYNNFFAQALYQNVTAVFLFCGAITLWMLGYRELMPYILVWTIGTMLGRILLGYLAAAEIRRNQGWRISAIKLRGLFHKAEGLPHYVVTTNLDGVVRVLRDLDIFLVNAVLGPTAVGLYRIARKVDQFTRKFIGPFYQAIYPELAKFFAAKDMASFVKLIKQSSISLGIVIAGLWLGFALTGSYLLPLLFGTEYQAAYIVALACIGGSVVWAFAQPLSPAMMALGKVQISFAIHVITTVLYVAMVIGFAQMWGLTGAGVALLVFYGIWAISMYQALKIMVNQVQLRLNTTKTRE